MDLIWQEWLNLFLRWIHVIAGVMWIGQTYLFNWMERAFTPSAAVDAGSPSAAKKNISGELWMVHGGGFYLVEKQKWPELMPRALHWFKWEAAMTWSSGMLLLMVVYWMGAPLLPYGSEISRGAAVALSAGILAAGWLGYNAVWRSPLARSEPLGAAVCWVIITALAYGLTRVFSDRSAYLHIGAIFGTIMVANVWLVIIPSQKKMMAITKAGGTPQPELAQVAARCSKHNTYMSVPLIFTMISNHFPAATFGRDYNWLILGGLVLLGWAGAKVIRDHL